MKEIIIVMDEDRNYSKKFCNQSNKLFGKKYSFLTFASFKSMKEYCEEHKISCIIISESIIQNVEDAKADTIYILNERDKEISRVGKKTYIYKLQGVKEILDIIDGDLSRKYEKTKGRINEKCKLQIFYSPSYIKCKDELIKKIVKNISKKRRVLVMDLDEFTNYKGSVGLSNVIYHYKENSLSDENLRKEIVSDDDIEYIKSVTYPEDFNVVNNIDLANIVNEIMKLGYDYVIVNADMSYVKSQCILNDADSVVLIRDKAGEKVDMFKKYLKTENQVDYKKITVFDLEKLDRTYMAAFCKQYVSGK